MLKKFSFVEEESHKKLRAVFSGVFIAYLAWSSFAPEFQSGLPKGECIVDYPFVWTTWWNDYVAANVEHRNMYMAFCAYLMDISMVGFLLLWWHGLTNYRLYLALYIFYGVRGFCQNHFVLGRPEGFLYWDPGYFSISVSYFDSLDFYFSGHVGSQSVIFYEHLALGHNKLALFTLFVIAHNFWMLVITRTHYIIDFTTAVAFGYSCHKLSEKLCYYWDVSINGFPASKRSNFWYTPCPRCGWNNQRPELLVYENELQTQTKLHALRSPKKTR